MAGHRKKSGRPLKGVSSAQLRRATYEDRMRAAQDPLERVEVTFDYMRSALVRAVTGHDLSDIEVLMRTKAAAIERDNVATAQRRHATWRSS